MDENRMWRRAGAAALCVAITACGGGGGLADPPAPPVVRVDIVPAFPNLSFEQPLVFATVPDDNLRAVVATRSGRIHIFDNDAAASTSELLFDLREQVDDAGDEMGLLGLAFDPNDATRRFLYVNYTSSRSPGGRRTIVSRLERSTVASGAVVILEEELVSFDQPFANHNGGWIGFGPDNKLYIASGDGGGAGDPQNNAQNRSNLLGKILRIEPGGGIPGDNPFAGEAGARSEIWAYGLRNPFRAGFDRESGELWVADVGQSALEEINLVQRGRNYGWRKFEGTQVFNAADPTPGDAVAPLYEYDHGGGRCSITGGTVYRGSAIPALVGRYVFADFCSREIWALRRDGSGVVIDELGLVPGRPTSFGEDGNGELYITAFDGKIYKLVPDS